MGRRFFPRCSSTALFILFFFSASEFLWIRKIIPDSKEEGRTENQARRIFFFFSFFLNLFSFDIFSCLLYSFSFFSVLFLFSSSVFLFSLLPSEHNGIGYDFTNSGRNNWNKMNRAVEFLDFYSCICPILFLSFLFVSSPLLSFIFTVRTQWNRVWFYEFRSK